MFQILHYVCRWAWCSSLQPSSLNCFGKNFKVLASEKIIDYKPSLLFRLLIFRAPIWVPEFSSKLFFITFAYTDGSPTIHSYLIILFTVQLNLPDKLNVLRKDSGVLRFFFFLIKVGFDYFQREKAILLLI